MISRYDVRWKQCRMRGFFHQEYFILYPNADRLQVSALEVSIYFYC